MIVGREACHERKVSNTIGTSLVVQWLRIHLLMQGDAQENSPTPQFKIINSLALSFLYPALTSIHDYWKSHSFD